MAEGKSFAPQIRVFAEMLVEFKKRLLLIIILLSVGSVIGYLNTGWLMNYLNSSVGNVIMVSPAEGFITQLKLAFTIGLILTLPLIIYIVGVFIKQKSPKLAAKNLLGFILLSYGLFWAGLLMAFFMIMPLAIKFLIGFSTDTLYATLSVGSYISFVTMLCLAFGFAFQLPIVINLLTKSGLVTARALTSKRKYFIVILFTIAAFITPPDIISQICLAVPLCLLYEICIFIAKNREKKQHEERMKLADPTNPEGLTAEEWQAQQKAKLIKDLNMTEAEYELMMKSSENLFGMPPDSQ